jgi:hypothetical protein
MVIPTKRLVWTFVIATPFLLATAALVIYLYGLPQPLTSFLRRPITEPMSEDYAVYSSFVDGFFSSKQPFRADQSIGPNSVVYVVGETLPMRNPGSILPLEIVALGPEDMGEDFFRQNTRSWPLQSRFNTSLSTAIAGRDMAHRATWFGTEELFEPPQKGDEGKWLPNASPTGPFPETPRVSGVLQFSRAGFTRRKRLAMLYYSYRCGVLCGQSGWVVLRKDAGSWSIERFGSSVVY